MAPKQQVSDAEAVKGFPVVGIGASAGGLAAFEAFFSGMPADTDPGMAFVLVQHLAPDHKSMLTDLIRRYTRMQVYEVEDGMVVQPNCAYIIPPNRDMAFQNGALKLLEPSAPRGLRLPIDFFFRSLAQDQHEKAICIILSGTGSDGTHGLRAVKGEGGMALAQQPSTTEYDGMPCSAIATGLVDYVLPPEEMPAQIIAYVALASANALESQTSPTPEIEISFKKIHALLRAHTGHDFSNYKANTIHRRIERRMAVLQVESIKKYAEYLQQTPTEIDSLFRDLLIGVTRFFRDPEPFRVLEERAIPDLFANKPSDGTIRVWCPGCSTGEEAYSIAILLRERMEKLRYSVKVQIFATDIDGHAIALARRGGYPANIASDVSPERLACFFGTESDGSAYRIHKSIRDMLIFSEHDLIRDPPFSRLDLVTCRNVMIYMGSELQKKIIPLFHYALNPGGFLFLGTSESVGEFTKLFSVVNAKSRLYSRKESLPARRHAHAGWSSVPLIAGGEAGPELKEKAAARVHLSPREVTEHALLKQVAQAGILVNGNGDILYLHGRTGLYLEPVEGEPGASNILKMAREGLRHVLSGALNRAAATKEDIHEAALFVKTNSHYTTVNLTVHPVPQGSPGTSEDDLYLVILEENSQEMRQGEVSNSRELTDSPDAGSDARLESLKLQLRAKEAYLQSTIRELEIAGEEHKSANEEMQSINEELQSTNEELETAKEELQSLNEELATVNTELQTKVTDLSQINNDMNNLLSGTGIATVFVDHKLRILRFTTAATQIINLILSDIGRPVGHIVANLQGYNSLADDVKEVLRTLIPKDMIVQTISGVWFRMHIQPYRTFDHVIEGAVVTFVDITDMKKAQDSLQERLDAVKTQRGMLTICPDCKRVRDEAGLWIHLQDRGGAEVKQDICPDCKGKAGPEPGHNEAEAPRTTD